MGRILRDPRKEPGRHKPGENKAGKTSRPARGQSGGPHFERHPRAGGGASRTHEACLSPCIPGAAGMLRVLSTVRPSPPTTAQSEGKIRTRVRLLGLDRVEHVELR